jgi:hypothetical protein
VVGRYYRAAAATGPKFRRKVLPRAIKNAGRSIRAGGIERRHPLDPITLQRWSETMIPRKQRPRKRAPRPQPIPPPAADDPRYTAAWRVQWWDWRGHHDFVGRSPPRRGGNVRHARKPAPKRHAQDFLTRDGAAKFIRKLRREIPKDELIVQVVSLRELLPLPPPNEFLPGAWPLQEPRMKGD